MKDKMKKELLAKAKTHAMLDLKMLPQVAFKIPFGEILCSEGEGMVYDPEPEIIEKMHEVEKEYDIVVWHIIHDILIDDDGDEMEMYSMLYFSPEDDTYRRNYGDGCYPEMAYVYNVTVPEFSEHGTVVCQPANGGLKRMWK